MRGRNLLFACISLSLLATVAGEGCGGSNSKALGTLGQACYADNRCNAMLTCLDNVCVTPGPGGTAPHDAGADAKDGGKDGLAGAGGTSGAGGGDAAAGADGGDASTADGGDAAAGHDGGAEASTADGGDAGADTSSTETGSAAGADGSAGDGGDA